MGGDFGISAKFKTRGPHPEPMDYSIIVDKLDYGGFITPLLPTEAFWPFGCTRTSTYLTPIVLYLLQMCSLRVWGTSPTFALWGAGVATQLAI